MDVLAGKLIRFLEAGDAPEGLFRPDVFRGHRLLHR